MEKITIEVEGKAYKVTLATTDEEREKGLQEVESLPEDEGMLFVFDEPTEVGFWMDKTLIPLDIIYIDENEEVVEVHTGTPESQDIFEAKDIKYVLEVNAGSGIKEGDDVDLSELETSEKNEDGVSQDEESEEQKMLILDPDGGTQMELEGGERIFSRPNTKTLIKLSKRAYKSKSDSDYKRLGRKVFQYLDIQNNKEEDYVEIPDTNK